MARPALLSDNRADLIDLVCQRENPAFGAKHPCRGDVVGQYLDPSSGNRDRSPRRRQAKFRARSPSSFLEVALVRMQFETGGNTLLQR